MLQNPRDLDVIIKYLDDPMDEKSKKDLELFCSASPENRALFEEIEKIWLLSGKAALLSELDSRKSKNDFRKSLAYLNKASSRKNWLPYVSGIAALLAIAVTLYFYFNAREVVYLTKTTTNEIDSLKLGDGSVIILADHSSLLYPQIFSANTREVVLLKGQALFEVSRDVKRPFLVAVGASGVKVLGTIFNVKVDSATIQVGVKKGKVAFTPYQNAGASLLTAGQALSYDVKNKISSAESATNSDAWLTKNLVFNDTPLEDVCVQLTAYYHTPIILKHSEKNHKLKKLNASFQNESLEDVLDILKIMYDVRIYKKANQTIIDTN